MHLGDNHYEFLGLDMSARTEEIEAAVQRLSEQAIALVYSSPQRSADLWDHIREIRRDLLVGPEGRQVYDESLVQRMAMASDAPAARTLHGRPPASPSQPPRTATSTRVVAAPVQVREPARQSRSISWPYAALSAAAVFAIVLAALFTRIPTSSTPARPVGMSLFESGLAKGSKYLSGSQVQLQWNPVHGASVYRLQTATAPGDPTDAEVFAHPQRSLELRGTRYLLPVTGAQLYYWRVQAKVNGRWQAFSASRHFAVGKPFIARPSVVTPVHQVAARGKNVRLCWSRVSGAISYRLKVDQHAGETVRGTCAWVTGSHSFNWSVAAIVRGAQFYSGSYSVAAEVRVTNHQRVHRVARMHAGARHPHPQTRRPTASIAALSPASHARLTEVAFAAPIGRSQSGFTSRATTSWRTTSRLMPAPHRQALRGVATYPTVRQRKTGQPAGQTYAGTSTRVSAGSHRQKTPAPPGNRPPRATLPIGAPSIPAPPPPPPPPPAPASTRATIAAAPVAPSVPAATGNQRVTTAVTATASRATIPTTTPYNPTAAPSLPPPSAAPTPATSGNDDSNSDDKHGPHGVAHSGHSNRHGDRHKP